MMRRMPCTPSRVTTRATPATPKAGCPPHATHHPRQPRHTHTPHPVSPAARATAIPPQARPSPLKRTGPAALSSFMSPGDPPALPHHFHLLSIYSRQRRRGRGRSLVGVDEDWVNLVGDDEDGVNLVGDDEDGVALALELVHDGVEPLQHVQVRLPTARAPTRPPSQRPSPSSLSDGAAPLLSQHPPSAPRSLPWLACLATGHAGAE
jgi:hypothetical protein